MIAPIIAEKFGIVSKLAAFTTFHLGLLVLTVLGFVVAARKLSSND